MGCRARGEYGPGGPWEAGRLWAALPEGPPARPAVLREGQSCPRSARAGGFSTSPVRRPPSARDPRMRSPAAPSSPAPSASGHGWLAVIGRDPLLRPHRRGRREATGESLGPGFLTAAARDAWLMPRPEGARRAFSEGTSNRAKARWTCGVLVSWSLPFAEKLMTQTTHQAPFDSSAGRAEDCRLGPRGQTSLGRWFDSGSKEVQQAFAPA